MTFVDRDLARRFERAEGHGASNCVDARLRVTPNANAARIEVGGTMAMCDGPDSHITQTFGLGLFEEATPAVLDELEQFFASRGAPVNHEVSPLAGIPLARLLVDRGYRPTEFTNLMYQAVYVPPAPALASGLSIRLMKPGEEELWSLTAARGWNMPEFTDFITDLGKVMAAGENIWCFFADLDGCPVATAALRCHEGVAHFAGAATIPEARNRGAQGALLAARMKLASDQGCDIALMGAEPGSASQRNAQRQGFSIAYTRTKWHRPLDAHCHY